MSSSSTWHAGCCLSLRTATHAEDRILSLLDGYSATAPPPAAAAAATAAPPTDATTPADANVAKRILHRRPGEEGHAAKSPLSKQVSAEDSDEDDDEPEELPPDVAAEAVLKQGYLLKRNKTKLVRPAARLLRHRSGRAFRWPLSAPCA